MRVFLVVIPPALSCTLATSTCFTSTRHSAGGDAAWRRGRWVSRGNVESNLMAWVGGTGCHWPAASHVPLSPPSVTVICRPIIPPRTPPTSAFLWGPHQARSSRPPRSVLSCPLPLRPSYPADINPRDWPLPSVLLPRCTLPRSGIRRPLAHYGVTGGGPGLNGGTPHPTSHPAPPPGALC